MVIIAPLYDAGIPNNYRCLVQRKLMGMKTEFVLIDWLLIRSIQILAKRTVDACRSAQRPIMEMIAISGRIDFLGTGFRCLADVQDAADSQEKGHDRDRAGLLDRAAGLCIVDHHSRPSRLWSDDDPGLVVPIDQRLSFKNQDARLNLFSVLLLSFLLL